MPPGPRGKIERPRNTKATLGRLGKYLLRYKWLLLLAMIMAVTSNLLALIGPELSGRTIDVISAGQGKVDFALVFHYAILMLVFYLISSLLSYVLSALMMLVGRRVARQMRDDVFSKLMRLPIGYFDRNQVGDIISRVSYDVDVINTSLSTDVVQVVASLITVVGSFAMMCAVCPTLLPVVLITIPFCILYTRAMSKVTRPLFSLRSAKYGQLNGFSEELFSGQKTIRAYAYEEHAEAEFAGINGEAADAYFNADYQASKIGPTVGFINNLSLALVAALGSILYMLHMVSLGQISSFVLYSRKFSGPINEAANLANEILSALAAAERVFFLLDQPEEIADIPDAKDLNGVRGDVKLDHVDFGYTPEKTILHDLSIDADSGKMIAIVGPTGAGKTTIINLLMRFYDPDKGCLYVDENELRQLTRRSLRGAWAMVLQDTWLFHGTIYDNIAYGREGATLDEVIAAAKAAHIHSYIMRLPKGYNTIISEDGGNISKGQKQLLTIARAMLYNAKMLILDEATSNVDTRTERHIQAAMLELMRGKTCFVIAHRLSTIRNADKIIVIDGGRICEQGTHSELMACKGFYYKLYASQFE